MAAGSWMQSRLPLRSLPPWSRQRWRLQTQAPCRWLCKDHVQVSSCHLQAWLSKPSQNFFVFVHSMAVYRATRPLCATRPDGLLTGPQGHKVSFQGDMAIYRATRLFLTTGPHGPCGSRGNPGPARPIKTPKGPRAYGPLQSNVARYRTAH